MIKALIFDLDGTLLDSLSDITNCVNYALEFHHQKLKSRNEVKKALGYGARSLLNDLVDDKSLLDEILNTYINYYKENQNKTTIPFDGIVDALNVFKNKYNFKLGIVSNKTDSIVKDLNKNIFNNMFEVAIGEQAGYLLKPEPDLLELACFSLNVDKSEVLFFGDTEVDLKTAQNANIKSIFVNWGFREYNDIKNIPHYSVANKPSDLVNTVLEIIENI